MKTSNAKAGTGIHGASEEDVLDRRKNEEANYIWRGSGAD
jgi:hypothetical protein